MIQNRSITRFGLIRHALTAWNLQKRIQGRQDSAIASEGEQQAVQWGGLLKPMGWNRILCSDAGRALKTAELINRSLRVSIHPEPELREQDWGLWTGKTMARIRQESSRLLSEQEARGWRFCPPGGEVLEKVWQRSRRALLNAAEKWPGGQILVVTHEGVIKSLIYRFNSRQRLLNTPLRLLPWHLHRLIGDRRGLYLEKINAFKLE